MAGRTRTNVELLYFDGCPNAGMAEKALKEALSQEDLVAELKLVPVNSLEEARRLGFLGSPTIQKDGRDLFLIEEREGPGLCCRVYATPEGPKGHPTAEMIRTALAADLEKESEGDPEAAGGEKSVTLGGVFVLLRSRRSHRFHHDRADR